MELVNFLNYGAMGLAMAFGSWGYKLLRTEQQRSHTRKSMLVAIYLFLVFALFIFSGSVVLEVLKLQNKTLDSEKKKIENDYASLSSEHEELKNKTSNYSDIEDEKKALSKQLQEKKSALASSKEKTESLQKELDSYKPFDPFKTPNDIIIELPEIVREHTLKLSMDKIDEIVARFNEYQNTAKQLQEELDKYRPFEKDFLYRILVFHKKASEFGETLNLTYPKSETKSQLAHDLTGFLKEIGHYQGEPTSDGKRAKDILISYQKAKSFANPGGYYSKEVLRLMIADYYSANEPVFPPETISDN